MEYGSKLLEIAVNEISLLPGIGKRSALRLALHLLNRPQTQTEDLAKALISLKEHSKTCKHCHTLSDNEICQICEDPRRENGILCIVEDIRGVLAIESTSEFRGRYHVLGGKISPMDGIGPSDLTIESLVSRVKKEGITELIFALSSTMEGDTTNFYIYKQLSSLSIKFSTIARGIAVGDELQYADEITLGRSISNRIPLDFDKG
jgi:recombination protein RecR